MKKIMIFLVLSVVASVFAQDQIPRPHFPRNTIKYPEDYCKNITDNEQFDFIVVGGGPAGGAVARRLAEIPTNRVLLLEAGGDPPPISDIPGNAVKLGLDIRWKFHTQKNEFVCRGIDGDTCKYVPGMVLGGSSVINYMMYVRGNHLDYDEWAKMGIKGWDYKGVLPYFRKLENYLAQPLSPEPKGTFISPNYYLDALSGTNYSSENVSPRTLQYPAVSAAHHGVGGPFTSAAYEIDPLTHQARLAIIEAFQAFGIQKNIDVNSGHQIGITNLPGMVDSTGYRYNTAKGYLLNIPDNLKVCKHAIVQKVNINPLSNPKKVTSVEFVHSPIQIPFLPVGRTLHAKAKKDYIISAGPLNSPAVLERSGIGIPEILEAAGVKPILPLNVGENYQDQFINLGSTFIIDYGSKTKTNPLSIELTSLTAFLNITHRFSPSPDIQYILKTYDPYIGVGLFFKPEIAAQFDAISASGQSLLFIGNIILRQTKHGSVHITQSADPKLSPRIIPNQLVEKRDRDLTIKATRLIRKIMDHEALKPFKPVPFVINECKLFPYNSDDEIMCGARYMASTLYHQGGSCSMGASSDPKAVVDSNLKVIGTKNLRVIDSSVMPLVTRGNTQMPTVMIGEKGADLVKAAWGQLK